VLVPADGITGIVINLFRSNGLPFNLFIAGAGITPVPECSGGMLFRYMTHKIQSNAIPSTFSFLSSAYSPDRLNTFPFSFHHFSCRLFPS